MIRELWENGRLVRRWDDAARRVTAFDVQGKVTQRRGWNNEEKVRFARGKLRDSRG